MEKAKAFDDINHRGGINWDLRGIIINLQEVKKN